MEGIPLEVLVKLIEMIGFSGVVFVIWLITVRHFREERADQRKQSAEERADQRKQFAEERADQKKQFGELLASQRAILDEMSKREQQNFQLLKQLIESNDYVAGAISSLSTKIDNNLFCPLMRKDNKS